MVLTASVLDPGNAQAFVDSAVIAAPEQQEAIEEAVDVAEEIQDEFRENQESAPVDTEEEGGGESEEETGEETGTEPAEETLRRDWPGSNGETKFQENCV